MNKENNAIDHNTRCFLSIVKEALYTPDSDHVDDLEIDWEYIYKTAARNNLRGIMYPAVARSKEKNDVPPELLKEWGNVAKINTFVEFKKYSAIKNILSEAEKEGIKLVFFKGCVLADLYPQSVLRNTSDTDIFVYERDKEKAIKLLERLGYVKNEEHSKKQVLVYILDKMHHVVELHFCLWEDYEGRKIDIISEMDLTREESLIELEACGMKITTLGHKEHLIFQMFHIIKHFVTEAVGIRYLADITLYVNRYGELIDYSYFWEQMKRLGFAKFCYDFFALCIRYFGMKDDILQSTSPIGSSCGDALLIDILNKGQLFEDKTASWQILGIMTPYLVGEETVPDSGFKRKLKVLFPSPSALPDKCSFAKRNKFLLPVAWAYKMIDFIIHYRINKKTNGDWYSAKQKLTVADYRLNLMKNLGLVEKE